MRWAVLAWGVPFVPMLACLGEPYGVAPGPDAPGNASAANRAGIDELEAGVADGNIVDADSGVRVDEGGSCPGERIGQRCFLFFAEKQSWDDAQRHCQQAGGRLAKLDSAAMRGAAMKLVPPGTRAWVGATDRVTEGTFLWSDNTALPLGATAGWFMDPRGNDDQDCVYFANEWLDKPFVGTLRTGFGDGKCTQDQEPFLCER